MRAFLVSVAIVAVISVAAALILNIADMSSAEIFQSQGSVRL